MTFTDKDIVLLRRLCQEIINNPRPMDAQWHARSGSKLWCEDWDIIEVLKYLFLGREVYFLDPPPNRLKDNPLWSKDSVAIRAEAYKDIYNSAEAICSALREIRHGTASRVS